MQHKILVVILSCFSCFLFGQTNSGKDLVFRVRAAKAYVKILPDLAWIDPGTSRTVTIRIRPVGRKIGKVTFKGGIITGQDSTYTLTAGIGTEGILSVYEKTPGGNMLIAIKVYPYKRILKAKPKKRLSDQHICYPGDGHHPKGIRGN